MRLWKLVAIAVLVFVAGTASAEVKWEQLPGPRAMLALIDECGDWTAECAEDFLCTDGVPITAVEWWGTAGTVWPDYYVIRFYSDVPVRPWNPLSHPGELLYEQECWDFTRVLDTSVSPNPYRISQNLEVPFCQEVGDTLWFSVSGVGCTPPFDTWPTWNESVEHWNDVGMVRGPAHSSDDWITVGEASGAAYEGFEFAFVLHGGPPFTPNVVCSPDLLELNKIGPSGTIDVEYLGGGSGPVGGYSVIVSWDDAVVDLSGVTEGDFLDGGGTTQTQFFVTGSGNSRTIDCVILDPVPGVSDPGTMFTLSFDADGDGTSPVDITLVAFRDEDNNPLCAFYEDDGEIEVERTDPTSSAGPLDAYQTTLTFTVPYTADDGGGSGVASVELFYQVNGVGGYSSYGSYSHPSSPISFTAGGDGFYEFYTVATDNAGNVETPPPGRLTADASTTVDTTDPTSSVDALPTYQTAATFNVDYTASDGSGSGVASVELFYQVDGSGSYASYGSFTSSPISFTAAGDGFYEFYTVATDNATNVEAAPGTPPDASTTVDTTDPISSVDALPTYQTALMFNVDYTASDGSGSGVASVELFYQVDSSGSYASYGSFTSSPISFTAAGDGFYEFYTVATDNATNVEAAPGSADASTTVDTAAPGNVTGFAAAPAHEEVDLSWDDATGLDTNYLGVVVRYAAWGDYPYYSTSAPAYPATETAGDGEAFSGDATSATHIIVPRDIHYYSAFVYDEALHYGGVDSGGQDRSTNYWLGDVANVADSWTPDGLVTVHDINKLAGTYGVSPPVGYNNSECDVGPTDDHSRVGIPEPDGMIQFEDLMIFSMNYGVVAAKVVPFLGEPGVGDLALALVENGRSNGGVLELALRLEGNAGDVKGFTAELEFEGLEFLSVRLGDEMSSPLADMFFWSNSTSQSVQVDAAVLGTDMTIGGSGDVVLFSFRVLDETYAVDFTSATLRGAANEDLTAELEGLSSEGVPVAFRLVQNSPNPFNPVTKVAYHVPHESRVTIRVFDVTGRLVTTLVDGVVEPGRHAAVWNGTSDSGESVGSGVYFCTMETPDYRDSHKMTLLK